MNGKHEPPPTRVSLQPEKAEQSLRGFHGQIAYTWELLDRIRDLSKHSNTLTYL